VGPPVQDEDVERQHRDHEREEDGPGPQRNGGQRAASSRGSMLASIAVSCLSVFSAGSLREVT
jgi:hypothetical protein